MTAKPRRHSSLIGGYMPRDFKDWRDAYEHQERLEEEISRAIRERQARKHPDPLDPEYDEEFWEEDEE